MNFTPGNRWNNKRPRAFLLLALLLVFSLGNAGDQDSRRALIGIKLFPSVLSADQEIQSKAGPDGRLHLLLVYRDNKLATEQLAERLAGLKDGVQGMPLAPEVIQSSALVDYHDRPLAGIFLAERQPDQLDEVISYARARQVILFSPFQEDVERGVASGLYVSDRILPYVNPTALRGANLQLKSFFLEVAKRHE